MDDPRKYIGRQFYETNEGIDVRLPFRGDEVYMRLLPGSRVYFMTREHNIDYWSTSPDHVVDRMRWFTLTDDQRNYSLTHIITGDSTDAV